MTDKKRIAIYLYRELYSEYIDLKLRQGYSKKYMYKYISHIVIALDDAIYENNIDFDKAYCKNFHNIINRRYSSEIFRTTITLTDEAYFLISSLKRRGYDINAYVNYALLTEIYHYKRKMEQ